MSEFKKVLSTLKGLTVSIIDTENRTIKGIILELLDDFLLIKTGTTNGLEQRRIFPISRIRDLNYEVPNLPQPTPPMRSQGDAIALSPSVQTTKKKNK